MPLRRLRAESPEFREARERHEVGAHPVQREESVDRYVGRVVVEHTDLWPGPETGPRRVRYGPAGEQSRQRPERLHAIALRRG